MSGAPPTAGRAPRFDPQQVRAAVAAAGLETTDVTHLPVGWGNENWRIRAATGDGWIVKLGPPGSAPKWGATHVVYATARTVGLPVPELVHYDEECDVVDGWTVRIFTWMPGRPPRQVLDLTSRAAAFFEDLALAMRALHSVPRPTFSSRLDGSAPSYRRWNDYVTYRLSAVLQRVRRTGAFAVTEADAVVREITSLADSISDWATPAICHRDLHLDNLLATADGRLAAILDFDGAEAWDPAIDVVKLRWLVFPNHPGAEDAFNQAYGPSPRWDERVRLVELLELLNTVPNAMARNDASFEASARKRLRDVLAD